MIPSYRVVVRLPVPVSEVGRIAVAFPDASVVTEHDEGPGVMVLDVPVAGGGAA